MLNHSLPSGRGNPGGRRNGCYTRHRLTTKKGRPLMPAAALRGLPVVNLEGEGLGILRELMIETDRGTVAYGVMRFEDAKSFALPFNAMEIDLDTMTIHVNIQREVFEAGRGIESLYGNEGEP